MTEGLTETPWAAMVVPTAPTPSPTGAKLTSSEVRETPVTESCFFPFFFKIAKMSFPLFFWTDGGRDKKPRDKEVKKQKTHEIRHGAKLTAVAERLMPVIALEMRAAPLENLMGGLMPLPSGVMRKE